MPSPLPYDPDILNNKFKKLDELEIKVNKLSEIENKINKISDLEIELKKVTFEKEAYIQEIKKVDAVNKEKDSQISQLKSELANVIKKNQELTNVLETTVKLRPVMKIEDLTSHFKEVITKLNKQQPAEGEAGVVIEQLEAEIKGGLDLKEGVQLSQILPQELSPQNVSSVKFTLRPTTPIKIAKD